MIGIITYDCPHLKTAQIIERCKSKIKFIFTIPFKKRPIRDVLIDHRPYQFKGKTPQDLGKKYLIKVLPLIEIGDLDNHESIELIVCGAGILPESIVNNYKVINAHPGLIPTTRGLDSFKWAIYYKEPMGITIHQINSEVDLGILIHHSQTMVYRKDKIIELSERHYRNEINSLCEYIINPLHEKNIQILETKEARMRMSLEKEKITLNRFNEFKENYA